MDSIIFTFSRNNRQSFTLAGEDAISQSEHLPELAIDDLVYAENIGAYSNAYATWFNGFPPAKVIHINE